MKRYIPSFLKSLFWHYYLKAKYHSKIKFERGVVISKDIICGSNCTIGRNTILGQQMIIGNGIRIGSDCRIEKMEIDDNSCIEGRVVVTGYGNGRVKIGKECYIGINNILDFSNNITIGNYVHIAGPTTALWTHSSAKMCLNDIPLTNKSEEFRPTSPIEIESNVYIGGNCTIYPGVTIGHHSIIAPNSAVTKNVEPFSLVGGVPAKFIKIINQE